MIKSSANIGIDKSSMYSYLGNGSYVKWAYYCNISSYYILIVFKHYILMGDY